jgi:hypothetical protein
MRSLMSPYQGCINFPKSKNYVKILASRKMARSDIFHPEDTQILRDTLQNFFSPRLRGTRNLCTPTLYQLQRKHNDTINEVFSNAIQITICTAPLECQQPFYPSDLSIHTKSDEEWTAWNSCYFVPHTCLEAAHHPASETTAHFFFEACD